MVINAIPLIIPTNLAAKKFGKFFPYKKYSITEKITMGKYISFKCSHVLSFTALSIATKSEFPDRSYVKCKRVPNSIVNKVPAIKIFFKLI